MASAGRLDVIRYLDASRAVFTRDGGFRLAAIDPTRDLELTSDGQAAYPRLREISMRVLNHSLRDFTIDEAKSLESLLRRVAHNVGH